jgi:hypothetical protein
LRQKENSKGKEMNTPTDIEDLPQLALIADVYLTPCSISKYQEEK